jgi:hypothetical protein
VKARAYLAAALLFACGRTSEDADATPTATVDAACQSCGAARCAVPGACSLAAACEQVQCGSATVDEQACLRPSCESDDDCAQGHSCISVMVGHRYDCVETDGVCECSLGKGLFPEKLCSPTGAGTDEEPCGAALCKTDQDCASDARCVAVPNAEHPECHATICSQL